MGLPSQGKSKRLPQKTKKLERSSSLLITTNTLHCSEKISRNPRTQLPLLRLLTASFKKSRSLLIKCLLRQRKPSLLLPSHWTTHRFSKMKLMKLSKKLKTLLLKRAEKSQKKRNLEMVTARAMIVNARAMIVSAKATIVNAKAEIALVLLMTLNLRDGLTTLSSLRINSLMKAKNATDINGIKLKTSCQASATELHSFTSARPKI